jgi:Domain of unknown function (DUF4190)
MGANPSPPERRPPPPPVPPARTVGPVLTDVWTPPKTSPMAIVSLVLSLLWLGGIGSVGAVVLGHMAKREIAHSEGRETGANLATAGLVIGYIGVAIMVIYLLIYVAALANG